MTELPCEEVKLTVPWGHIAAKTYGSSKGKPVLMVHGQLDNAGTFTRLMKYLPMDGFYYVCIDLPGHGWSSHFPSWQILNYLNYVYALHFILEALKWKTCIYIGHSMGGKIGLMFSAFQPHRIKKVIVIDTFLLDNELNYSLIKHFKNTYAYLIKANNVKLYTKEEILYALKNLRRNTLNSEAANAVFEHAVTEVNGKYKYNRDIRLKYGLFLQENEYIQFIHKLAVPIYIFVASNGLLNIEMNRKKFKALLNEINPKTKLQIINVDGNHDVHNNNPENIGPFICEILITDYSSKL
jgi:pimeloyl-ACP methyl ester carboxylesterase